MTVYIRTGGQGRDRSLVLESSDAAVKSRRGGSVDIAVAEAAGDPGTAAMCVRWLPLKAPDVMFLYELDETAGVSIGRISLIVP